MYNTTKGDFLKEFDEVVVPPSVDKGVRLANYLIDYILSYLFGFLVALCLVLSVSAINPYFGTRLLDDEGTLNLLGYLFFLGIRPLYYVLLEGLTKGRTVGKLVTATVAIRTDGKPLEWGNVFARAYSRIVPFETFSGLGQAPWHDQWSNTTVVYKADLMTL
ncbi:RDD family protein [Chitinophaga silvisoli]|uniref:RDD domain-containing protein n=1 Tax=Chitinophaga silvisoli TaxID=2291814 RepID=A0A3E1P802_9BACT|nr:RDD family protein [Chitinophaga silvisoli]RFM36158.1 hypothetical protein DXN04_01195 [Chitinophaga silvisoli]